MIQWLKQYTLTKLAGLIILSAVIYGQFSLKPWEEKQVVTADAIGYYSYLPAMFIYDDLKLEHPEKFAGDVWYLTHPNGSRYIKFTCGMAIAYSPFFFIAHSLAESLGYPADGYSVPYQFALAMSALVFLLIALIFLSKLLLLYFKDLTVAVTLLILFTGTNAYTYYSVHMIQAHGYSLALIAVFLYCTVQWISDPRLSQAIWIGLTAGLFVLIRPIDVLFLLALPLINVLSLADLKKRFMLFRRWRLHILIMFLGFCIMLLPQLLYFKTISGSFLFFPYSGESFFFGSPHLFDSLLSYRNGWLVYSPLMLLAIIGFFFLRKMPVRFGTFLVPTALIYFYVIASWWCWWYSGFGNRAYINLYPLLSIPLAGFIQWILEKKWLIRTGFKLVVMAGIALSCFQSYQFAYGVLHWSGMTKEAYWDAFLREYPSQIYETLLRLPVDEQQKNGRDVVLEPVEEITYRAHFSFENVESCDPSLTRFLQKTDALHGTGSIRVDNGLDFIGEIRIPVKDAQAISITGWTKDPPRGLMLMVKENPDPGYFQLSEMAREHQNGWDKLQLYKTIPEDFRTDTLILQIWNPWREPFVLDDLDIKMLKYTYIEKER